MLVSKLKSETLSQTEIVNYVLIIKRKVYILDVGVHDSPRINFLHYISIDMIFGGHRMEWFRFAFSSVYNQNNDSQRKTVI